MTEKLNVKVFLGDSLASEDFSFSLLSSNKGESKKTILTNELLFSSIQNIPFQSIETENERREVLTNGTFFAQNIKASPKVSKPEDIRTVFNNNIITTLFFLFPTYYGSVPNIHNSYDDKIPHSGIAKINAPVLKKNRVVSTPANGIVYYKGDTVIQLTWRNDVFNVPEFQQLFSAIYGFYVWSKTEGIKKIKAGFQKITENLLDSKNGIEKFLEKSFNDLPKTAEIGSKSSDKGTTSSVVSIDTVEDITKIFKKLKDSFLELKLNFNARGQELIKEKTDELPVNVIELNKSNYEKKQDVVLSEMSQNVKELIYYSNTYFQNSSHPAGSIVKSAIENFSSLISNRSINDALENNEYIFKTDEPLPKNQQTLYDNLEKYPEYAKMTKAVADFRAFVLRTSNPDLDRLCGDFFGNNNRNLLYFILYCQKNFLGSTKGKVELEKSFENIQTNISEQGINSSKLYYVGGIVQRSNKNWLIYVGLDVIRGKVSEINQDKIKKCVFGNEKLGNLFTELIQTTNRASVKNYFYDVIDTGPKILEQSPPKPKQGGKTRKRRHNRRKKRVFKKTRRHLRVFLDNDRQ